MVTLTLPLVPLATTAVTLVALATLNDAASVPPKLTAVVPVKAVPVMVTVAPVGADAGEKEVMVGRVLTTYSYAPIDGVGARLVPK